MVSPTCSDRGGSYGSEWVGRLLLRYDVPTTLVAVSRHVKILMEALVNNYGHWDVLIESQLSKFLTIKRLPRLLRMVERAKDEEYMIGLADARAALDVASKAST